MFYLVSQDNTKQIFNVSKLGSADDASSTDTNAINLDVRQQHIRVKLRKPMGMVLAEKGSTVFVEEMTAGGNADKSGKVEVGDVISK